MALGFIGTGAITEAIVRGIRTVGASDEPIYVSTRNRERSARLATELEGVLPLDDNAAVVERSDTVVLAVLPTHAEKVLAGLPYRDDQTVVSLVAMLSIDRLHALVAPTVDIHRAIPMPPIEFGVGPTVVYPGSPAVDSLFGNVSRVVVADSEADFDVYTAASSSMAPFFDLAATIAQWMETRGASRENSASYVTALFEALAQMASNADGDRLQSLPKDCQTAGGLNEQAYNGCREADWAPLLTAELEKILHRVRQANAELAANSRSA